MVLTKTENLKNPQNLSDSNCCTRNQLKLLEFKSELLRIYHQKIFIVYSSRTKFD